MGSLHERSMNLLARGEWATNKERKKAKEAKTQKKKDKIFAGAEMPDEEFIRRNARRLAAQRRGSRVSTVLTETLG